MRSTYTEFISTLNLDRTSSTRKVRTDNEAKSDATIGSDSRRRMNVYVTHDVLALVQHPLRVEKRARQEGFGMADVHPKAFELVREQIAVTDHGREDFLLDRNGLEFDSVENRCVENVQSSCSQGTEPSRRCRPYQHAYVSRMINNEDRALPRMRQKSPSFAQPPCTCYSQEG